MHYLGEIETAVETIRNAGNEQIVILHCVSNYPPAPETVNLKNIPMMASVFGLPVGLSDHSQDNYAAIASVAFGACMIEKHVTLDRKSNGPDHPFALDPAGMFDLVKGVREVEKAIGREQRVLSPSEQKARQMARRSIVAKTNIKKGTVFTNENLKISRPGTGLHPKYLKTVLGRRALVDIEAEDVLNWGVIE
jgi:sialic acid synthase SpsE